MKVVIDNSVFPPRTHYTEVDTKFTSFTPKCRVLPANYYADYNTFFTLKARYEPGENKYFPKGGFEIYHSEGGLYNYELDEVVVHPFELGMRKYFSKSESASKEKVTDPNKPKGKRGRPKSDVPYVRPVYVPTGGKRGRRPLDPEVKAEREAQLAAKQALPRGKRGRPKKQTA